MEFHQTSGQAFHQEPVCGLGTGSPTENLPFPTSLGVDLEFTSGFFKENLPMESCQNPLTPEVPNSMKWFRLNQEPLDP